MNMELAQSVTVVALIAFVCLMIAIGVFSWRRTHSIEGFLLGGRNIGPWVSAFAYGTSYFSAVIFIGYAGKHGWDIGLGSLWIGIGNAFLGCWLAWKLLAKRTRSMTHTLAAKTMPEFFEGRYASTAFKVVSALIIFIFLVPYSAAVYKGLGSMFSAIFPGVPESTWMLVIAAVTAIYLMLGGYVAAAYTDFVQGMIMIFGVIAMVVAIVNNKSVGGFGEFYQNLAAIPDNGDGITGSQLTNFFGDGSWKFLCVNILLTSFGTWGLPQMVSKYYAIKDDKSIKTATTVSTLFALIIGAGAYFIGSLSRLVLGNQLPAGGHDAVIPTVLVQSLGGNLGTIIILAVILLLLLSASMSTLSSVVLSSASAISIDLAPVVHKGYTPKQEMRLTRFLCILFVALSYVFATQNISIIVNIMSFSWGIVAGCFIGPYIWGIYSKRITKAGAWAGLICGFLTVAVTTVVLTAMNAAGSDVYTAFQAASAKAPEMGVGAMAVSLAVTPVVSLFTKRFDEKHLAKVFNNQSL
ncbi:MAG TPA: sodium:solute symporter [Candidatus Ornithomonoglobus intestinigallinarum]|uniref:Sodium:solute symporter n=1 Tax=Candidatus Ornithomonoglobus intestinigallinarum TaxID=2840894 RepID=A0A9D1H327_9FIRM|nr:sodium:solute symporter [Candidatus Ornithomonoglobus intestinigallinarum]